MPPSSLPQSFEKAKFSAEVIDSGRSILPLTIKKNTQINDLIIDPLSATLDKSKRGKIRANAYQTPTTAGTVMQALEPITSSLSPQKLGRRNASNNSQAAGGTEPTSKLTAVKKRSGSIIATKFHHNQ